MPSYFIENLETVIPYLFKSHTQSELHFSHVPNGASRLFPGKLIQGLPHWGSYSGSAKTVSKDSKYKLLFADPYFPYTSYEVLIRNLMLLKSLRFMGFELFIINQDRQLERMDSPWLMHSINSTEDFKKSVNILCSALSLDKSEAENILAKQANPNDFYIFDWGKMCKLEWELRTASEQHNNLKPNFMIQLSINSEMKNFSIDPDTSWVEVNMTGFQTIEAEDILKKMQVLKEIFPTAKILMQYPEQLAPKYREFLFSLPVEFQNTSCRLKSTGNETEMPNLSQYSFLKKITVEGYSTINPDSLPKDLESLNWINDGKDNNQPNFSTCSSLKKLFLMVKITNINVDFLPRALECLTLHSSALPNLSGYSSLRSLSVLVGCFNPSNLPSNLESLCLDSKSYFSQPDLSNCSSLKKLILTWRVKLHSKFLPPNLISLEIQGTETDDLSQLHSLKKLKLLGIWSKSNDFNSIPEGIEVLCIQGYINDSLNLSKFKNLKKLAIPDSKIVSLHPCCTIKVLEYTACADFVYSVSADSEKSVKAQHKVVHDNSYITSLFLKTFKKKYLETLSQIEDACLFPLEINTKSQANASCSIRFLIYQTDTMKAIDPTAYRQEISDKVIMEDGKLDCVATKTESYKQESELAIDLRDGFLEKDIKNYKGHFFCQFPLNKTHSWVALPSLSSQDKILACYKPSDASIRYNLHFQCYEIYTKTRGSIQFLFKKEAPFPAISPPQISLPEFLKEDIEALLESKEIPNHSHANFPELKKQLLEIENKSISKKRTFCQGTLKDYTYNFEDKELKKNDKLSLFCQILTQAAGSCMHRTFVYVVLCQYLGIHARQNEMPGVHRYPELWTGSHWEKIQLSGTDVPLHNLSEPLSFMQPEQKSQPKMLQKGSNSNIDESKTMLPSIALKPYYDLQIKPADHKTTEDVIEDLSLQHQVVIKIENIEEGRALHAALYPVLNSKENRPILYLESMDEVYEQWEWCVVDKDKGQLKKTPGVLQQLVQSGGVLIINCLRFKASEMASLLSLSQMNATFRGVPLSSGVRLFYFLPKKRPVPSYSIAEFIWPEYIAKPKPQNLLEEESTESKEVVDLYGDPLSFSSILVGEIKIGGSYDFTPGILNSETQSLTFIDPPLSDPGFQSFIHQCKVTRTITSNGKRIPLSQACAFYYQPTGQSQLALRFLNTEKIPNSGVFFLNRYTMHSLFSRDYIKNNKREQGVGWLKQSNMGHQKTVVKTDSLDAGMLRRIKNKLTPDEYKQIDWLDVTTIKETKQDIDPTIRSGAILFEVSDPYFKSLLLKKEYPDAQELFIYEQTSEDACLEDIKVKLVNQQGSIELHFEHQLLFLAEALGSGKTLILTGHLSEEFYLRVLESLFGPRPRLTTAQSPEPMTISGKLLIVSTPLPFKPYLALQQGRFFKDNSIPWEAMKKQLQEEYPDDTSIALKYNTLAEFLLKAQKYQKDRLDTSPLLRISYLRIKNCLEALNLKNAADSNPIKPFVLNDNSPHTAFYAFLKKEAKAYFGTNRPNITPVQDPQEKVAGRLQSVFSKHRTLTLKGPSGSGKTFSAFKYTADTQGTAFFGLGNIGLWIKALAEKNPILIIDEANLLPSGALDFLMPMLFAKPGESVYIYWDQKYHQLSAVHKVIFTGNPDDYPGRNLHDILRDGPTIVVKSWSPSSLKKYIVAPLCTANAASPAMDKLIQMYLRVHALLLPVDILSVRDLQQVTIRWLDKRNAMDQTLAAYSACKAEWSQRFVNQKKEEQFRQELQTVFGISKGASEPESTYAQLYQNIPASYILGSKQKIWLMQLHDDYQLARQYGHCINPLDGTPMVKQGLFFEGEAGIGKTCLITTFLKTLGLQLLSVATLLSDEVKIEQTVEKYYIQFSPSMDLAYDESILLKAFHGGYKVFIDGLNLSQALENILNQLLTGKDLEGNIAQKPGFYVFATAVTGSNCSIALKNRLHITYGTYTQEDAIETAKLALKSVLANWYSSDEIDQLARQHVATFTEVLAKEPRAISLHNFFKGLALYCREMRAKSEKKEELTEILRVEEPDSTPEFAEESNKAFRKKTLLETTTPIFNDFYFDEILYNETFDSLEGYQNPNIPQDLMSQVKTILAQVTSIKENADPKNNAVLVQSLLKLLNLLDNYQPNNQGNNIKVIKAFREFGLALKDLTSYSWKLQKLGLLILAFSAAAIIAGATLLGGSTGIDALPGVSLIAAGTLFPLLPAFKLSKSIHSDPTLEPLAQSMLLIS